MQARSRRPRRSGWLHVIDMRPTSVTEPWPLPSLSCQSLHEAARHSHSGRRGGARSLAHKTTALALGARQCRTRTAPPYVSPRRDKEPSCRTLAGDNAQEETWATPHPWDKNRLKWRVLLGGARSAQRMLLCPPPLLFKKKIKK